jgi:hypothetical protein
LNRPTTVAARPEHSHLLSGLEATGSPVERDSTRQCDANFEAFPTLIQTESSLDELDLRETAMPSP